MTWTWSDTVLATDETDASLRRKLQRGQVTLDQGDSRTRATLMDIARLRISKHLTDSGFLAERAFGLATLAAKRYCSDAVNSSIDKVEKVAFWVAPREGKIVGGVHIIEIDPKNPKPGMAELTVESSLTKKAVVPIHRLVVEAWSKLPGTPPHIVSWINSANAAQAALLKGIGL